MKPMTMDERVEAAARATAESFGWRGWDRDDGEPSNTIRGHYFASARAALAAAFPELHGDQPKGWIAPWESDGAMDDAAHLASEYKWIGADPMVVWAAMRDAYLGKGDGG